jgi:hypothetical protein
VEEIMIGAKQADPMLGPAAPNPVPIAQIEPRLSIQTKVSHFFVTAQQ